MKLLKTIHLLALDAKKTSGSSLHAIKAIIMFFICQMKFLFGKKTFDYIWDDRIKIKIIQGEHGTTECYYLGLYDWDEMHLLKKFIHEGDGFLDVGANVGTYALLISELGGVAYAFEPSPRTYGIMCDFFEKMMICQEGLFLSMLRWVVQKMICILQIIQSLLQQIM